MADSKTHVCNLALRHVGVSTELANVDTDTSAAAKACRAFFTQARDETLATFSWPWARAYVALALVAADPTVEWSYSYRYPVSALKVWRFQNGVDRTRTRSNSVSWWRGSDATGGLLYADIADPVAEVTDRTVAEMVARWPASFAQAVAALLAFYIQPSVAGSEMGIALGKRAYALYEAKVAQAMVEAANEDTPDPDGDTDSILARN